MPLARREAHVRVRHVRGRMRPAVHPDRAPLHVRAAELPVRNDLLRRGILVLEDAELDRAAIDVRDVVRLALMLEHRDARDVERLGVLARRIVHRHAREVALHVAGHAIALILVIAARPFADERELRVRGDRRGRDQAQRSADEECPHARGPS